MTTTALLAAAARGYTGLRPLAAGLEFLVYEAVAPDGSRVVLRTPDGGRFQSNANDPAVDTRDLLRWEYTVTRHVAAHGVPVAAARELILGEPDVLVSDYLEDDGGGADPRALGRLLRRLHRAPPPPAAPVAGEGVATGLLLPARIRRRWRELAEVVALPPEPDHDRAVATLAGTPGGSLVHLDVRAANLRRAGGEVAGLLDWSNALIAGPELELGRLAEFARLPGNGLDLPAILDGYGQPGLPDTAEMWLYRLDAALMLAVVFTCEAPDEQLGAAAAGRLAEVRDRLLRIWDR